MLGFLNVLPISVAYWGGLCLSVLALGAMVVYLIAHFEQRG